MAVVQSARFSGVPPPVIRDVIFGMLTPAEVATCAQTCLRFRDLFREKIGLLTANLLKNEALAFSYQRVSLSHPGAPTHEIFGKWCQNQLDECMLFRKRRAELSALKTTSEWKRLTPSGIQKLYLIATSHQAQVDAIFRYFVGQLCNNESRCTFPAHLQDKQLREWHRSDGTKELFSRVTFFRWELGDIPPEISKLSFRDLIISVSVQEEDCRTSYLPPLPHTLESVEISFCNFLEIPSAILDLPNLTALNIFDNLSPIRAFPDALARRVQTRNDLGFFLRDAKNAVMKLGTVSGNNNLPIDRTHLTHIPFFIWLRETFSLPHISFFALPDLIRDNLGDFFWIALPILIASLLPLFAFNLLVLSYNLFLNFILEPVVTYFRDQLGYSRMVAV
ncbi:MAG: hypothetical protein HYX48_04185 [Chlamydiales bacterium]|nr:hypothetical protein [Chlamydiales bacterium]